MKTLKYIVLASTAFIFAMSFSSCTSDAELITLGAADEFSLDDESIDNEDIDENVDDENNSTLLSSSSKKTKSASSKKEKSSASNNDDDESEITSSSKTEPKDSANIEPPKSSNSKDSSGSEKASPVSSSEKAVSSSSKKKNIPGMEGGEIETPNKSSDSKTDLDTLNKEDINSDSENEPKSSAEQQSKDTIVVVSDKDKQKNMDPVSEQEQKEIEEKIENGDPSITKLDSLIVESGDLHDNEYFCKTPDGSWYKITSKFGRLVTFFIALFTGNYYFDFSTVCDELYIRPKNH